MIRAALRRLKQLLLDFHEATMRNEYEEVCRYHPDRSHVKSDIQTVLYAQQIDRLAWNEDISALRAMILDLKERVAALEAGGANR